VRHHLSFNWERDTPYWALLRLLWQATAYEVRCTIFEWPQAAIRRMHRIYSRAFLIGAVLYLALILAVWLTPGGQEISKHTRLRQFWVLPPAACVIGFLLAYNWRLHWVLARCKATATEEIDASLTQVYEQWRRDSSRDSEARVSELIKWRDHLRQRHDWPTDLRGVAAIVTTLLLPTFKAVIDLLKR
jgi:hypothetical protein